MVLILVAFVSFICIRLLIDCSDATGLQGYGDIAFQAAGPMAKGAVHVSLVISQFGTNIAYIIFVMQMTQALGFDKLLSQQDILCILVLLLTPLCFSRSIHKLEAAILVADFLIIVGLFVCLGYGISFLKVNGVADLQSFKSSTCGLFIGTAVFTFEGIPFILPIRSSMQEPQHFWQVFCKVFPGIVLFFTGFGLLGYAAYGDATLPVVLKNMPQGDILAQGVQGGYVVALILGSPLVFLPAAKITELWVFGAVEKGTKTWPKNGLRACEVCLFALISLYGGQYFQKFLAFVGALCCAPIAFIYPCFFHLRLCATSTSSKLLDCFIMVLGVATVVFVLFETVSS